MDTISRIEIYKMPLISSVVPIAEEMIKLAEQRLETNHVSTENVALGLKGKNQNI